MDDDVYSGVGGVDEVGELEGVDFGDLAEGGVGCGVAELAEPAKGGGVREETTWRGRSRGIVT